MASTVNLKALGLYTAPNQLSLEQGSLTVASNVVIRQEGIIEPRRGFKLYGNSFGSSEDTSKQLFTYKNRLIRHYSNILQFDNGSGTFNSFSGNYTEPVSGLRMRKIEANGNFYFTSSEGIQKISAASPSDLSTSSGYITLAGGIKATNLEAYLKLVQGDNSSFLPADSVVSYKIVWGTKDANSNLILGTDSQQFDVAYSLRESIILDLLSLSNNLDFITSGLITDDNYTSTINTALAASAPVNASAQSLKTALVTLAEKLDNDIKLSGASAPLTFSSLAVAGDNKTITITFSAGDPTQYISVDDKVILSGYTMTAGDINASQTITEVTSTTIKFVNATTVTAPMITSGDIYSNNYRSIAQPGVIDVPTPNSELVELKTYLESIITRLQSELSGVIPSPDKTTYIDPFETTSTGTVNLIFNIPSGVTSNHFYQVYRTTPIEALQTAVLEDLIPSAEYQLVYEAYPTQTELTASIITLEDTVPEAFKGDFLYTNPSSGEGILQANDVPPFCKDINQFKNYTFFANTRTRYRNFINLLGVQKLITDYNNSITPKIVISSANTTINYSFIVGQFETSTVQMLSFGAMSGGDYFTCNSSNDLNKYYFWYDKTGSDTDPAISGRTGVRILISGLTTPQDVAQRTNDVVSTVLFDFKCEVLTGPNRIRITNLKAGTSADVTSSFSTVVIEQQGSGEKVEYHKDSVTFTIAPTASSYFYIYGHQNTKQYYVWYKVDGTGSDPLVNGSGILVEILSTDSLTDIANKTATALNNTNKFVCNNVGAILYIENYTAGLTNTATVGSLGGSITISNINPGALNVLLSNNTSPSISTDETAKSLLKVINQNRGSDVVGYYLSGVNDTPGQLLIESKTLADIPFSIMANNSNTGSSFNPDISPTHNITSISTGSTVTVTSTSHGLSDGNSIIIMNSNSTPSIDGIFTVTNTTTNTFDITSSVFTSGTSGVFALVSEISTATNEVKINRIYYSKLQQPEAVPILNYFDVGSSSSEIHRIFPLRDSLFIFKDDGIFRVSGEVAPFSTALFDGSSELIAPDTVDVVNNLIFCWTRQGITVVSESGVNPISRQIEFDLFKLATPDYPSFETATWGIGYSSDNSYTVFTVQDPNDTVATIGYRYSTLTNSWTTIDKSNTCGVIPKNQDLLYLGAGDTNYIEVERKSFNRTDYADREETLNIANNKVLNNGKILVFSQLGNLAVGDVIQQSVYVTPYLFNSLLQKLDTDPGIIDNDYYSTLQCIPGDNIRTKLETLANKLDSDTGVSQTDFYSTISTKSGSITGLTASNPITITSASHGLFNGRIVDINSNTSIPDINNIYVVSNVTTNTFTIPTTVTTPSSNGTFITVDNNIDDIQSCFNKIISKLNADSNVAFSNYITINSKTDIEAIVESIDLVTKQVTLNIALPYVVGDVTAYKAIHTQIRYSPITMGNPLSLKHLFETTLLFKDKTFTKGILKFGSDLLPELISVPVIGQGNGIFGIGTGNFGLGFFGGNSHSAPFRTYIPRNCQRCTYLNLQYEHSIAREKYVLYGTTITGNENSESTRGYR